jgi:hypothetical protein
MNCLHCHVEIEPAEKIYRGSYPPEYPKWRHKGNQMFTCFGSDERPIREGNGYCVAEPEEGK